MVGKRVPGIAIALTLLACGLTRSTWAEEADGGGPAEILDAVELRDGDVVRGFLLDLTDEFVLVETKEGKVVLERDRVKDIRRSVEERALSFYDKYAKRAKSAEHWRKLASFCETVGLLAERRGCLRKALALEGVEPDEEMRKALGRVLFDGTWISEIEAVRKLSEGYEVVEGRLVRKETPEEPSPPPKSPKTIPSRPKEEATDSEISRSEERGRKRGKAGGREDILAIDHLQATLEERDPHSLWMLLSRSGIPFVKYKENRGPVTLKTCQALIREMEKEKDYRGTMKTYLDGLGVPRDWEAINKKTIEEFLEKYPPPRGYHLETRYYHILSTARRKLTRELGAKMDVVVAQVYHRIFDFEEKIPRKYILRFWKDREQFLAHGASPSAAAYYHPLTKELVGYNQRADPYVLADPFQTLYHEGWHQYFDYYIPNAPRWFDEGLADLISATEVRGGRAIMKAYNPGRHKVVARAHQQGRLIPLRDILRMSKADFYRSRNMSVAYAQAWSFVYFLSKFSHRDPRIQSRVRNFNKEYFWELHKGTDPVRAVDVVFGDVKFETLEAAWKAAIPRMGR